ncbi:hypothetical protein [Paenibacillus prosopidis]|uniref:Uncharacterized protein n=1 Tax=Paenibacillus prosopidis TaxID=630520 RepID=A0A368W2I5_9BACL|nr:hypothetical protein [Paenibacillus prosopidis]RCW49370.1 hypothetical protein DFP97_10428 [Paenibacillus prosopidis]
MRKGEERMHTYPYFDQQGSIANIASGNEELELAAVANRFVGSHPKFLRYIVRTRRLGFAAGATTGMR